MPQTPQILQALGELWEARHIYANDETPIPLPHCIILYTANGKKL
jgi:hypothetical protein